MRKLYWLILIFVSLGAGNAHATKFYFPDPNSPAEIIINAPNKWHITVYEQGNVVLSASIFEYKPLVISDKIFDFKLLKKSIESKSNPPGKISVTIRIPNTPADQVESTTTYDSTYGALSEADWNNFIKELYSKLSPADKQCFDKFTAKFPIMLKQ